MSAQPNVVMIRNTELPDVPLTDAEMFATVQALKDADEEAAYAENEARG